MSDALLVVELVTDVAALMREVESVIGGDLSEELRTIARPFILQANRDNFTSSASPNGANWKPRKRQGDGHPLLEETGALLQAATGGGPGHITRITGRSLAVGVDASLKLGGIPGALAHNFGYPPRKLPKREWLGPSNKRLKELDEALADGILGRF